MVSCSSTKELENSLKNYPSSIKYLHDSKIDSCDKSMVIALTFDDSKMDDRMSVTKKKQLILPFLFINYTQVKMNVKLGRNLIDENYTDFFRTSFQTESYRNSCFTINNRNISDTSFILDITIDTVEVNAQYIKSSTLIFALIAYYFSMDEYGFPAQSNLKLTAKLSKGDSVLSEKQYTIQTNKPFLNSNHTTIEKLRASFVANMVESLSESSKKCIENIIQDVNNDLQNYVSKP
jgi:hypothetical protein